VEATLSAVAAALGQVAQRRVLVVCPAPASSVAENRSPSGKRMLCPLSEPRPRLGEGFRAPLLLLLLLRCLYTLPFGALNLITCITLVSLRTKNLPNLKT